MWTHEGYEEGCDARVPSAYRRKVMLRETKTMWISKDGRRFSKKHFGAVPGAWPMYRLNLSTVRPVGSNASLTGARPPKENEDE